MKHFDEILIRDLPIIVEENCLMNRYHALINVKEEICEALIAHDITTTLAFMKAYEEEHFILEEPYGKLLYGLLKFHMFKTIKLKKVEAFKGYLEALDGISTVQELLVLGKDSSGRLELSRNTGIPINEILHLVCMADMMRLAGVKNIRANLYVLSGFRTISDIANSDIESVRKQIGDYIDKHQLSCSVPHKKEVATQIAWAKVLPKILII